VRKKRQASLGPSLNVQDDSNRLENVFVEKGHKNQNHGYSNSYAYCVSYVLHANTREVPAVQVRRLLQWRLFF